MPRSLKASFFDRDTRAVARDLLGCVLVVGQVHLRIVETEAYIPGDSANHSYRGQTPRNAPMWGPPGHLYVYLCYGIHRLLNLVTEAEGRPAAVLGLMMPSFRTSDAELVRLGERLSEALRALRLPEEQRPRGE